MNVEVNGKKYRIEFQYRTRFGKRAVLGHDAPYKAITLCTIVMDHEPYNIVLGAAVCDNDDHFSRPKGRKLAFLKALASNNRLDPGLLLWFKERFPDPPAQPEPAQRQRPPLSQEERQRLIDAGATAAKIRRARRARLKRFLEEENQRGEQGASGAGS